MIIEKKNLSLNGFSLIEVIVGLAVIVATVVLLGVAVATIPLTKTARNQNLAYHIAAKKIEELKNTPFDSLPVTGTFSDPGLANLDNSSAQVYVNDYSGNSEIKNIVVEVHWEEGGDVREVDLATLIAR